MFSLINCYTGCFTKKVRTTFIVLLAFWVLLHGYISIYRLVMDFNDSSLGLCNKIFIFQKCLVYIFKIYEYVLFISKKGFDEIL